MVQLSACTHDDTRLRDDLTLYLQQAQDWAPVEAETSRTIARILATQFVDEAEVRRQIRADLPRVAAHIARVRNIHPSSPELAAIQATYLTTWRDLATGYNQIERGLDHGIVTDVAAGRASLAAWRQGIIATADALRRLRHDLEPQQPDQNLALPAR